MIGIARRILDCMLLEQKRSHLSHEVLTTLMAEVTAIMNARPLIPVSSDPESLLILTPAMLLTFKRGFAPPPPSGSFEEAHLIREGWKQVQGLADMFWNRWKREYLKTLELQTIKLREINGLQASSKKPFQEKMDWFGKFKWKLSRMEPERPFLGLLQEWFYFFLQRLILLINVGSIKTSSGECHAALKHTHKMAVTVEPVHKMAATTIPLNVIAARHESIQVTVDVKEPSQVTVDVKRPSQVKVNHLESSQFTVDCHKSSHVFPESRHITADHPEPPYITADHPESCVLLSVTPRYSRSVLRSPSLVSSVRDTPLVPA